MACGILAPLPAIEHVSPVLEGRFLTTGPPGKSQDPSLSFLAVWCHVRSYGLLCRVCSQASQIHLLMLPLLAVQGSSKTCPSILWPSAHQEVESMSPPLGVETNLESVVTIENGRSDMMWLPRLGLKDNSVSTKFSRDTQVWSPEVPYKQCKGTVLWGGPDHVQVSGLQSQPRKVCADQHQLHTVMGAALREKWMSQRCLPGMLGASQSGPTNWQNIGHEPGLSSGTQCPGSPEMDGLKGPDLCPTLLDSQWEILSLGTAPSS